MNCALQICFCLWNSKYGCEAVYFLRTQFRSTKKLKLSRICEIHFLNEFIDGFFGNTQLCQNSWFKLKIITSAWIYSSRLVLFFRGSSFFFLFAVRIIAAAHVNIFCEQGTRNSRVTEINERTFILSGYEDKSLSTPQHTHK